jgi:hypothetical protein
MKICGSKGYRIAGDMNFLFGFFDGSRYENSKQIKRQTQNLIPLDSLMSPDLPRGMGKSIGGDLDVDDEGSEQRRFKPVQSLHHGSVGYQPMHTQIGLSKKAMSLQANQEHKQEQKRTISNCR